MDEGGDLQTPPNGEDRWCSYWPAFGVAEGTAQTGDALPQCEPHCEQEACAEKIDIDWKASIQEASATLRDLEETVARVRPQLDEASSEQLRLPIGAVGEEVLNLQGREKEMLASVQEVRHRVNELRNNAVLPPPLLYRAKQLLWSSVLLTEALEVLLAELEHMMKGECDVPAPIQSVVRLVITSQPFPKVSKMRTLGVARHEEPLRVRLLASPRTELRVLEPVAVAIEPLGSSGRAEPSPVSNGLHDVDPSGLVTFDDIRFQYSTRLHIARCIVSANVRYRWGSGAASQGCVKSTTTEPLIVISNEAQYPRAASALMKESLLGRRVIPWALQANCIQEQFVRGLRAPLRDPVRPLSRHQLHHIHRCHFEGQEDIDEKATERFRGWFGPLVHSVKYQRHIKSLWERGCIFFLSNRRTEEILDSSGEGTYLMRFADREAGKMTVSFSTKVEAEDERTVEHCVVEMKLLLDFIATRSSLLEFALQGALAFCPGHPIASKTPTTMLLQDLGHAPSNKTAGGDGGDQGARR